VTVNAPASAALPGGPAPASAAPPAAPANTSAARRRAILEAALEAFTEKGFAAATIEDVRRLSGASVGSIYHHFGDKEGLAAALYLEGIGAYQRGALGALTRSGDPERGIKSLVRFHLRWVAENPKLASFLLNRRETEVVLASEADRRELNRAAFAETAAWLRPHVESGRVKRMPMELYYLTLIGPSQEFARHWLGGRASSSMREAESVLAEAAWDSVRAKGDDEDG
jgi:AcrR family transcriptional regulator